MEDSKVQKKIKSVLEKIHNRHGIVTPELLLAEAENENSPVHSMFEWDNDEAADRYRLWQARQLIRKVKVTILGRETNAYWNVKVSIDDKQVQGYFPTEQIIQNRNVFNSVLRSAVRELNGWKEKYESLKELQGIIDEAKLKEMNKIVED